MTDTPHSERTDAPGAGRSTTASTTDHSGADRRTFLKATAAAGATGVAGVGSLGSVAGQSSSTGIPTPALHRDGKWIKDPSGNKVVLRGVNIPDIKRMDTKEFRPDHDETISRATGEGWHTRIIRIPVQPLDIGGHNAGGKPPVPAFDEGQLRTYIDKYLRPAVDFCAQRNVYCIVDYHRHKGTSGEHNYDSEPMDQELRLFWSTVAPEFAGEDHVLFEVYNEPIAPYQGQYDPNVNVSPDEDVAIETWNWWKDAAQPWVDIIRENAPENLILIGSPRWTQWTYQAPRNEFEGDNLAYTGHVYAHPNMRPLGNFFGEPATEVPVFMTEFGWGPYGAEWLKGSAEKEGQQFTNFFENYPSVHWQVWCFDAKWSPAMMDHDWSLNGYGQFWKEYLAETKDSYLPGPDGTEPTPDDTPTDTPTNTPGGTPSWPTDPAATDPDGDGQFEDLTGNGEIDNQDVVTFFQNMGTQANPGPMSQNGNTPYYDYSGNDAIDYQDLIALFGEL